MFHQERFPRDEKFCQLKRNTLLESHVKYFTRGKLLRMILHSLTIRGQESKHGRLRLELIS